MPEHDELADIPDEVPEQTPPQPPLDEAPEEPDLTGQADPDDDGDSGEPEEAA